jgi:hypothetical protein
MRFLLWITKFWPLLRGNRVPGRWEGFLLAFALGLALNTAVIATFGWQQGLATGLPGLAAAAGWVLVLGFLVLVGHVALRRQRTEPVANPEIDTLFRQAQHEYLRSHWLEAETLIKRLLKTQPDDVESLLLLASVQRRTKRVSEARRTLDRVCDIPAASRWLLEIDTEQKLLDPLESDASSMAISSKAA